METIRLIVAVAVKHNWSMYQLDVKSAFLNGELEEEVYVSQPPGFEIKGKEYYVYKLDKALYGLKQAPRAWNKKIDRFLVQQGFAKCVNEHGIYCRNTTNKLIICLYVDDMITIGSNDAEMEDFKKNMMNQFEMSYLGNLTYFLGIEFEMNSQGVIIHQRKYALDILKRFKMLNCKPISTLVNTGVKLSLVNDKKEIDPTLFKHIVGSLRYLCHTRPDIAYGVGLISRYMVKPINSHLIAAKRILRYVKGICNLGIRYYRNQKPVDQMIVGYSDLDWSGDKDDKKSTVVYGFVIGNAPFSWSSKKELVIALSSCEAEYIATSMTACQAQWINMLLIEMQQMENEKLELRVDIKSAIDLAKHTWKK